MAPPREQQGFVNAKGEVSVRHPITGAAFWVPREKMQQAMDEGWELEPAEDYAARVRKEFYDQPGSAFSAGVLRSVSLGASTAALNVTDPDRARMLHSESPWASITGEATGFLVPMAGPSIVAKVGGVAGKALRGAKGARAAEAGLAEAAPARVAPTLELEAPSGAGRFAPKSRAASDIEAELRGREVAAAGKPEVAEWQAFHEGVEQRIQKHVARRKEEIGRMPTLDGPGAQPIGGTAPTGKGIAPKVERQASAALADMAAGRPLTGPMPPAVRARVDKALGSAVEADAEIGAIEALDAQALGKAGRAHSELQQDVPAGMFRALGGPHGSLGSAVREMPSGTMKAPRWTLDEAGELVIGEGATKMPATNAAGRAREAIARLPKDSPAPPAASPATAREALSRNTAEAIESGSPARATAAVEGALRTTAEVPAGARAALQREAQELAAARGLGRPRPQVTGPQQVVRVEPGRQVTGPQRALGDTLKIPRGARAGGFEAAEARAAHLTGPPEPPVLLGDIGASAARVAGTAPQAASSAIRAALTATAPMDAKAAGAAAREVTTQLAAGAMPEAIMARPAIQRMSEAGQSAMERMLRGVAEGGVIGFTQGVAGASMIPDPAPGELGRQVAEGLFFGALAGGLFTAGGIGLSSVTRKLGNKAKDAVAAERMQSMRQLRKDLEADVRAASEHQGLHKALAEHEVAQARRRALGSSVETEAALEDAVKKVAREAEAAGFPMGRGPQSHVPVHEIPAAMEGVQRELKRAGGESFGLGGMGNWIAQSSGAALGAKLGGGFGAIIGSTAAPWAAKKLSGMLSAGASGARQIARGLGVLSPVVKFVAIRELTAADYKALREEAATMNPADTRAAALEAYQAEGLDPDTAKQLADFQGRRTAALVDAIKRGQSPEALKRSLNAILDPRSPIKSLADGWLSEEERRALATIAPGLYRQLAEAARLALEDEDMKWKMSADWRSTLQRIAGDPLYASGVIGMQLSRLAEEQQKQDAARAIRGRVGMPTLKREGLELDRLASGSPGG